MKYTRLALFAGLLLFFSGCDKDPCGNLLNEELTLEERKWIIPAATAFRFQNGTGDTQQVQVTAPVFTQEDLESSGDCDYFGNQMVTQNWQFTVQGTVKMNFQHFNNATGSQYLRLTAPNAAVFRFNAHYPDYTTLVINNDWLYKTLVDSAAVSSGIQKVFYGKQTGILRLEMANGEVWERVLE